MVRALQTKSTPADEDRKESTVKKRTPTKKKVETGVWPCKMNGCNKEFAREADLKRHQRTTKLHSMPGFACPQCEATFTRTDALRRHQKSRHNGIVMDPDDKSKGEDDEPAPTGSKSGSRSGTPASKKAAHSNQPSMFVQPSVGGNVPPPPQGYYRQQGMNSGTLLSTLPAARPLTCPPEFLVYVAPRPQNGADPNYPPPVGVPTSASRLQPQPGWAPAPPPPWGEGAHVYPHFTPYYYHPGILPPPHAMLGQPPPPPSQPPQPSSAGEQAGPQRAKDRDASGSPHSKDGVTSTSAPVIDPALDGGSKPAPTLELTNAAMQAVFEATARDADRLVEEHERARRAKEAEEAAVEAELSKVSDSPSKAASPQSSDSVGDGDGDGGGEADGGVVVEERKAAAAAEKKLPPPKRQPSMQHMLTEDGEPMLNP
ncbi:hypothetical protein FA95DRAFT_1547704, partial [Auriscalpium vulgare]